MTYPKRRTDRLFLIIWSVLWHLCLPIALLYLWRRGRKEPLYSRHIAERFGGGPVIDAGAIWIHAVSLGETRAASPLIRALLDRGDRILLTNMTAAGRTETCKLFADDIAQGRLQVRWCPIELAWAVRRFLRRHKPKLGMILEIELWPQLIAGANRMGVPLVMAQAQYPDKSFDRDQKGLGRLRANAIGGFNLILAKSTRHAERFRRFGGRDVRVTGELRFEQAIPQYQVDAATAFRAQVAPERPVFCLASTAPDEDDLLIPVVTGLLDHAAQTAKAKPFFVYVPRHPKDFGATQIKLEKAGLKMAVRSRDLDAALNLNMALPTPCDGLFGDSLGEINFYYALADTVFVGDSFNGEGSHNIIEPLRLSNPVAVGPSMWGIEYPGVEALEAGVLTKLETPDALQKHWSVRHDISNTDIISDFLKHHGGATQKILDQLEGEGFI